MVGQGILLQHCSTCGHCELPTLLETHLMLVGFCHDYNPVQNVNISYGSLRAAGKRTEPNALQNPLGMLSCHATRANGVHRQCCWAKVLMSVMFAVSSPRLRWKQRFHLIASWHKSALL